MHTLSNFLWPCISWYVMSHVLTQWMQTAWLHRSTIILAYLSLKWTWLHKCLVTKDSIINPMVLTCLTFPWLPEFFFISYYSYCYLYFNNFLKYTMSITIITLLIAWREVEKAAAVVVVVVPQIQGKGKSSADTNAY